MGSLNRQQIPTSVVGSESEFTYPKLIDFVCRYVSGRCHVFLYSSPYQLRIRKQLIWERILRSSGPIPSSKLLLKWHSFPALLVQWHDYCAHLRWFKRKLLWLKKLAVMHLPVFRVHTAPLLLEITGIKSCKTDRPQSLCVTIL